MRRGGPSPSASATRALFLAALFVSAPAAEEPVTSFTPLPGGPPVSMDYLAYDALGDRVVVPAGNTGKVDLVDGATGSVSVIEGFETAVVRGRDGHERVVGPSSATAGEGFIYVGTRAGNKVCAIDARALVKKGCATLPSSPDGVAYVSTTQEVWVTTPGDNAITILDVKTGAEPRVTARVPVKHPEGYAVDPGRGLFYTNLAEDDETQVLDVRTRKEVGTFRLGCGEEEPHGLALDVERRHLFVACSSKVKSLDAGHGAVLGEIETGAGLDNIDFLPSKHFVYAAAGRAGQLTVAEVSPAGLLRRRAQVAITQGGRTVVVDARGTAYVADSKGGRLIVVRIP
jgi:DNA-binding beta-propeller fold protein YncE